MTVTCCFEVIAYMKLWVSASYKRIWTILLWRTWSILPPCFYLFLVGPQCKEWKICGWQIVSLHTAPLPWTHSLFHSLRSKTMFRPNPGRVGSSCQWLEWQVLLVHVPLLWPPHWPHVMLPPRHVKVRWRWWLLQPLVDMWPRPQKEQRFLLKELPMLCILFKSAQALDLKIFNIFNSWS